jgi:hypothetical protein
MRHWSILTALAVGLVVVLAAPSVSGAATPGQDSVAGSVEIGLGMGVATYDIDAFSGPTGEGPGGTVIVRGPLLHFDLIVTCLRVSDSRAVIEAGDGDRLTLVLVLDDRPAGEPDRGSVSIYFDRPPPACAAVDIGAAIDPVRSGSITVTDAPALPTTKDDCKHGGWAAFGFRNQGQCVKSVVAPPKAA